MERKPKNRQVAIGLTVVSAVAVVAAVWFSSSERDGTGSATPADIAQIQREMRAQTPSDLGTVPPEKAQAGLRMMGPRK